LRFFWKSGGRKKLDRTIPFERRFSQLYPKLIKKEQKMKKIVLIGLLVCCVLTADLIAGCGTSGGGSAGSSVSSKAASYYSGAGGKGASVAILVPEGKGLSAEQNYLPTLVQGVFVSDFAKYSAISVLDRQALEKTLRETESGIYEEGADFVELGKITKTGYILSGSVTKTSSGYSFAVTVADTTTGEAKAAYSGACTVQQFDDFSGIKKASLELLTQMGVTLTGAAKAELSGAGKPNVGVSSHRKPGREYP
jgi:TolB-like protein